MKIPTEALERMEKEGWPSIQEQTDHWNTVERLEHERVMDIRAESPNVSNETGQVFLPKEDYDNLVRDAMLWRKRI